MRRSGHTEIDASKLKALILDLDGTLLDNSKRIPASALNAIERLQEKGIKLAIFTGRDYLMAREYLDVLNIEGPHALQNGAFLAKGKGEIFLMRCIERKITEYSVSLASILNCHLLLRTDSSEIPDWYHVGDFALSPYLPFLESNINRIVRLDDLTEVVKSANLLQLDITGDLESLKEILGRLTSKYTGDFNFSFISASDDAGFLDVYWSQMEDTAVRLEIASKVDSWGLLSLFNASVSKGLSLDDFLNYHGLASQQVAFIGDHYADIPLLKRVGLSVAVENALPEVKAVCDYVTQSNNDDGVALAIEEIFFSGKR
ncbi:MULTISPECIES: HAD family hydrolase [Mesotoga]|uniref:HAD-superfamily hydrolase, subfamily IIB n=1 Tax=Mesotoga prima MesG1.Ag.4.2 TaxID=660470 RepID=I2F316_9BACT|nr:MULTISPECIES: HAD family hydrolase [Mesotoga]MCP5456589.1 HAD family hydrolase [Thermotogota bacterium]CCU85856.1 Haloacid dehalogenase domain protein hydrolase type 3 [Mesotoga infera]AFK06319.1 HAD-superfamily hydrolase, subfamily IIB [Mesotoga prima MesG1.Ag.4.2]MCP5460546.1 HAD family hydrolase [Thermotogota bacterium]RLL88466.1 haloacid dehalogenase [Mesotoga sp. H07pep.5.4]